MNLLSRLKAAWPYELKRKAARRGRPPGPSGPYGLPGYARTAAGTRSRSFVPLDAGVKYQLYRDLRKTFPVLDVAISKYVHLVGHLAIKGDEEVVSELNSWLSTVRVNAVSQGFQAWLENHLDQSMQFGKGIGEIVVNRSKTDVYALTNLDPTTTEFRMVPNRPLDLEVIQWQGRGAVTIPAPYAVVTAFKPQGDSPHGVSMYRSLPVVGEALSIIENATVQVWKRYGCPTNHVKWMPPDGFNDPDGSLTTAFMETVKSSFVEAMAARDTGDVQDFFTAGDVEVKTVGSIASVLELSQPFRAFAEQVVAATELPSWMFGFGWQTTETLSVQQADMLLSTIEGIRRSVYPAIRQVIELRQALRGKPMPKEIGWSDISLRDLTEHARGLAWESQAHARRIENAARMWELGFWDQTQAAQHADPEVLQPATVYATPPVPQGGQQLPAGLSPDQRS